MRAHVAREISLLPVEFIIVNVAMMRIFDWIDM
jgi:hypothetical protein